MNSLRQAQSKPGTKIKSSFFGNGNAGDPDGITGGFPAAQMNCDVVYQRGEVAKSEHMEINAAAAQRPRSLAR
jgi:hypothetical protein